MSYQILTAEQKRAEGYCTHFPNGFLNCDNYFDCCRCTVADRIRTTNNRKDRNFLLLNDRDCLRQTKSGGGETLYNKPIVLKEKAMERLGIEKTLFNQIAVAYDGPGVFVKNPGGEIDCYLFNDKDFKFTISRYETYGIPNMAAVEKWEELFFMGLKRIFLR